MNRMDLTPLGRNKSGVAFPSLTTLPQLTEFLNGEPPMILVRTSCCVAWVDMSLLFVQSDEPVLMTITTNGSGIYTLPANVRVLSVTVDTLTYYASPLFGSQEYVYDSVTGELVFTVAPAAGLNLSIIYI